MKRLLTVTTVLVLSLSRALSACESGAIYLTPFPNPELTSGTTTAPPVSPVEAPKTTAISTVTMPPVTVTITATWTTIAPPPTTPPTTAPTTAPPTTTTQPPTSPPPTLPPPSSPPPATGTLVGGTLSGDTVWTLAGSPYALSANVQIPAGARLTIEAGVAVDLRERSIQVDGALQALGTAELPVRMTGGSSTAAKITFLPGAVDWDDDSQDGCLLCYAIIQGNVEANGLVRIEDASPQIINCTLESKNLVPGSDGLVIQQGDPQIIQNRLLLCGIREDGGSPQIIGNTLLGNLPAHLGTRYSGTGISYSHTAALPAQESPIIHGNVIAGYGIGLHFGQLASADVVNVTSNNITANTTGIHFYGTGLAPAESTWSIWSNAIHANQTNVRLQEYPWDIDLSDNWWGTTDEQAIAARLFHKPQDARNGTVTYLPCLPAIPAEVPPVPAS